MRWAPSRLSLERPRPLKTAPLRQQRARTVRLDDEVPALAGAFGHDINYDHASTFAGKKLGGRSTDAGADADWDEDDPLKYYWQSLELNIRT